MSDTNKSGQPDTSKSVFGQQSCKFTILNKPFQNSGTKKMKMMTMMIVKSVLILRSFTQHPPRNQLSRSYTHNPLLPFSAEMTNRSNLKMLTKQRRESILSSKSRRNPTQAIATEREVETPRMSKDKKEATKALVDSNKIDQRGDLTSQERIDLPERKDPLERK